MVGVLDVGAVGTGIQEVDADLAIHVVVMDGLLSVRLAVERSGIPLALDFDQQRSSLPGPPAAHGFLHCGGIVLGLGLNVHVLVAAHAVASVGDAGVEILNGEGGTPGRQLVDDAPFLYTTRGGEFEVKVKIAGDYKVRFDQAGLMLRTDKENYIKAGIEFVDGKYNISCVVTHHTSDWSVITLDKAIDHIWIKAVRRLDAVEIFYSFDDKNYTMMRNCHLADNTPVMVGMMAACPDGKGFEARFEEFKITHLPDLRRLEWLNKNKD